ncbi:unnamed protein product [Ostreobium quekettii]|uniref:RRM domain-containing protein n=1 Tax=Ostreobium quekettii TaxID=121088 RepID=A0A8S1JEU1_9CHLO|nr:unnamed protein product [Ostreobium quekettii]|eukprot:evm.model.scf_965EXC.2 EVM.evm.TU.scf_965EXC.2   scf_965EXC:27618-29618(+)
MAADAYLSDCGPDRRRPLPQRRAAPSSCPPSPRGDSAPDLRSNLREPPRRGTLFVADVRPRVTERQLFELFGALGPVASVRICRARQSMSIREPSRRCGHAYVNYQSYADPSVVRRALEELNYREVGGGAIRVMRFVRDPALRRRLGKGLYVKYLAPGTGTKDLHHMFARFGPIFACRVPTDAAGKSLLHGFVQFESAADADRAVEQMDGAPLGGKRLFVTPTIVQRSGHGFTQLCVRNLDCGIDNTRLRSLFRPFGPVAAALVMRDEAWRSKSFGFVDFNSPADATRAIAGMHDRIVEGRRLSVAHARRSGQRNGMQKFRADLLARDGKHRDSSVYVRGLHEAIDDRRLLGMFSRFGTVVAHRVMRHRDGESRGFGFVCFAGRDQARAAVRGTHGATVRGQRLIALIAREHQRQRELHASAPRQPTGCATTSEAEDADSVACDSVGYDSDWSVLRGSRASSVASLPVRPASSATLNYFRPPAPVHVGPPKTATRDDSRRPGSHQIPPGLTPSSLPHNGKMPPGLGHEYFGGGGTPHMPPGLGNAPWNAPITGGNRDYALGPKAPGTGIGAPARAPRGAFVGDLSPRGVAAPPAVGAYKDVPYEELDDQHYLADIGESDFDRMSEDGSRRGWGRRPKSVAADDGSASAGWGGRAGRDPQGCGRAWC